MEIHNTIDEIKSIIKNTNHNKIVAKNLLFALEKETDLLTAIKLVVFSEYEPIQYVLKWFESKENTPYDVAMTNHYMNFLDKEFANGIDMLTADNLLVNEFHMTKYNANKILHTWLSRFINRKLKHKISQGKQNKRIEKNQYKIIN